jgi:hypothetical protein
VIGPQAPSLAAVPTGSRLHINIGAARAAPRISEDAMRKNLYIDQELARDDADVADDAAPATGGLPNRLLTAFEVAEYISATRKPSVVHTRADCSPRSDSACVGAAFTRRTCSTGSSAAHRRAFRKPLQRSQR